MGSLAASLWYVKRLESRLTIGTQFFLASEDLMKGEAESLEMPPAPAEPLLGYDPTEKS